VAQDVTWAGGPPFCFGQSLFIKGGDLAMRRNAVGSACLAGAAMMLVAGAAWADSAFVQRIASGRSCLQATGSSDTAAISADGKVVAFASDADNLSEDDSNGFTDIYVYSLDSEQLELISRAHDGGSGNNRSFSPAISADGRLVAFVSLANDLVAVAGDSNAASDIFLYDRRDGTMTRVNLAPSGAQANNHSNSVDISADGNLLVFSSLADNLVDGDTNDAYDIFVFDRKRGTLALASRTPAGGVGNHGSSSPRISANGKWVVFSSNAADLVAGDSNEVPDIFLYDVKGKAVELVSVDREGGPANEASDAPAVSGDGRYVAFESDASDLIFGDTNAGSDVFVRDRQSGTTTRISVSSDGEEGFGFSSMGDISADGAYVVFSSTSDLVPDDTNGVRDVFLSDRNNADPWSRIHLLSRGGNQVGNGVSQKPAIGDDGSAVAFTSAASNLVPGDTNAVADVFRCPAVMGNADDWSVVRCSVGTTSFVQPNNDAGVLALAEDGRHVVFRSIATNLVPADTNAQADIFLYDRLLDMIRRLNLGPGYVQANGDSGAPRITGNVVMGPVAVFHSDASNLVDDDTNGNRDIFIHHADTLRRITNASGVEGNGQSQNPDIAGYWLGYFICFESKASNLAVADTNGPVSDIFVYRSSTGAIELVSRASGAAGVQGNDESYSPSITSSGNVIAFQSLATNLVAGDTNGIADIFVRDRSANTTTRVSVSTVGTQANGASAYASVSDDGRYVCFSSSATNLVTFDTNGSNDVFVHDRTLATTTRVSVSSDGIQATGGASGWPQISPCGRFVAFCSSATNLVDDDSNVVADVFVHDRQSGRTARMTCLGGGQPNGAAVFYQPAISDQGRHIAFVSAATNLIYSGDTNGRSDAFVAGNPLGALSPGCSFPLIPGEIDGFMDATFSAKPKLSHAYNDPVAGKPKAKAAKVLTAIDRADPPDELLCTWTVKQALYDKKLADWKTDYCRDVLDAGLIGPCEVARTASTTFADGTRLVGGDAGNAFLVPPEICHVADLIGWVIRSVSAGDEIRVGGGYFGSKPPKVWLEYRDAKGKLKQLKCKVQKNRFFDDAAGKPAKSCMDPANGFSEIIVQMPAKWPKGWMHGRHDLVIDNGCGRAFVRLLTE
jgi:hypothetical protein